MKEAFKKFLDSHPFLSFFGLGLILASIKNIILGVACAITGNYPPAQTYPIDNTSNEDALDPETENIEEHDTDVEDLEEVLKYDSETDVVPE